MKIFNKTEPFADKVNFIDDNNVVLGYDTSQLCCETADWFIADKVTPELLSYDGDDINVDLEGWNFDRFFFQEIDYVEGGNSNHKYNDLNEGGMVVFRITKGNQEKFLHLYNCHNGYYSHGFEFKNGKQIIQDGSL